MGQDSSEDEAAVQSEGDDSSPAGSDPEPSAVSDEGSAVLDEAEAPGSWPRSSNHTLCIAGRDQDPAPLAPPSRGTASAPSWAPPRSRADLPVEKAALAHSRRGRPQAAIEILAAAYGDPLMAFAVRILRDSELAKDVWQQVFLEALQGLDRFEGRSSLWTWLCSIAYHRCVDHKRKQPMSASEDSDLIDSLAGAPDATMDEDRIEKRRALERCLGKLPAPLRAQLLMRFLFGLSYQEIGELIDEPHGTVQVRMSRLLPRLRGWLRGEGIDR